MLNLKRTHDFQIFLSPCDESLALTNPPSFNWPHDLENSYDLFLELKNSDFSWSWSQVRSPFQISDVLPLGEYRWRVTELSGDTTNWFEFTIDGSVAQYKAPAAKELFGLCEDKTQFLMYFDEDISSIKQASSFAYETLQKTADLAVSADDIQYPTHYKRGFEAGKRTAINNVRNWIDRDLMSQALLYKIWADEEKGHAAASLLLALAQWSPEGPASLERPCTWGDEVGLSLSRNLYLAYHWLAPLMNEAEKGFVRPMLIRIAHQMETRLTQDQFSQYPGHSHTSRLPAYLGIAALALHKEYDSSICERWLDYALMIYKGVLPFYGGADGSWAEGAFYSSSYSKWQHPFFLSVERLSDFSFYEHPFYKNYHKFALDFVASDDAIHPFGDGFWCKRESVEWPGFFAQNPLRIYASRFGCAEANKIQSSLESNIDTYALHLLDIIPTKQQLEFNNSVQGGASENDNTEPYEHYYGYAGYGIATRDTLSLTYRASQFGNSSHRHADQGNIALMDAGRGVLVPSGSYGYCFGSKHHSEWTRTTFAHNLPIIGGRGQILDDESAKAQQIGDHKSDHWSLVQLDLTQSYEGVASVIRTVVLIANKGVVVIDHIDLASPETVDWRLHSHFTAVDSENSVALIDDVQASELRYLCVMKGDKPECRSVSVGYTEDIPFAEKVQSDATNDVTHLNWHFGASLNHTIVMTCLKNEDVESYDDSAGLNLIVGNEHIVISKNSQIRVNKK